MVIVPKARAAAVKVLLQADVMAAVPITAKCAATRVDRAAAIAGDLRAVPNLVVADVAKAAVRAAPVVRKRVALQADLRVQAGRAPILFPISSASSRKLSTPCDGSAAKAIADRADRAVVRIVRWDATDVQGARADSDPKVRRAAAADRKARPAMAAEATSAAVIADRIVALAIVRRIAVPIAVPIADAMSVVAVKRGAAMVLPRAVPRDAAPAEIALASAAALIAAKVVRVADLVQADRADRDVAPRVAIVVLVVKDVIVGRADLARAPSVQALNTTRKIGT